MKIHFYLVKFIDSVYIKINEKTHQKDKYVILELIRE